MEEWHHLLGAQNKIIVYTDHKNLWILHKCLSLEPPPSKMEYVIISLWLHHHLSTLNTTRVVRCFVQKVTYCAYTKRGTTWPPTDNSLETGAILSLSNNYINCSGSSFLDQVCAILATDRLVFDIKYCPSINWEKFQLVDGLFYFEEHLYILEGLARLCVLQTRHDFWAAEHFGFNKTLGLISRDFS